MFADEHSEIPPSEFQNQTLKDRHPPCRALSLSAQAELRYKQNRTLVIILTSVGSIWARGEQPRSHRGRLFAGH